MTMPGKPAVTYPGQRPKTVQPNVDPQGTTGNLQFGQQGQKPNAYPSNPNGGQSQTSGQSPYPYATMTPFGPGNDLQATQITPGRDPRLSQTQGQVNTAAGQVANSGYSPWSAYQAQAAPYQAQGNTQYTQATGAAGQQAGYGQQAQQYGQQYGAINPTLNSSFYAHPGSVSSGSWSQGPVNLPGISTGPLSGMQDLNYAGDTGRLRGSLSDQLFGAQQAPDRVKLGGDAFKLYQEQQAPLMDQKVRDLGKATGAFGRSGSGLVNSQLADIGTAFKTSADQQARGLATDAAGQTMNDRLNLIGATQSGLGALGGMDTTQNQIGNTNRLNTANFNLNRDQAVNDTTLAGANFNLNRDSAINSARQNAEGQNAGNQLQAAGQNASIANQLFGQQASNRSHAMDQASLMRGLGSDALARGQFQSGLADQAYGRGDAERNALSGYETNTNNYGLNRLGALSGLEAQQYGQGADQRNELRGERGWQNNLSNQNMDRLVQQYQMTQGSQGQDFDQWLQQTQMLGQMGGQGDPYGAQSDTAGMYNQQDGLGLQDIAQYAQQFGYGQPPKYRPQGQDMSGQGYGGGNYG